VQPYFIYDSRLSGTSQHGVLWKGGMYQEETGWVPVIGELVSNGGDGSNHGDAPRNEILQPTAPRIVAGRDPDTCRPSDLEINSLVVTAGEALKDQNTDPVYNIERHYRDIDLEVFYFNNAATPGENCDRTGPGISAGTYHALSGNTVNWSIPVTDVSGVWRVVVVYNDGNVDGLGRGSWIPIELTDDGTGTWRGSIMTPSSLRRLTYVVQAVDRRGNVTWVEHQSVTPPASGVLLKVPATIDVRLGIRQSDFDADSRSDIAVYDEASGLWYVRNSSSGTTTTYGYGGVGYKQVSGDYDGDGRADFAVYHPATGLWFIRESRTGSSYSVGFGGVGFAPLPRDYDGDGRTDLAVYHQSTGLWYVRNSASGVTTSVGYGGPGYLPVPADYDGDRKADVAVFHAATGIWFIRQSATSTTFSLPFGASAFTPVPRDYDGDGKSDLAAYHEPSGLWYVRNSSTTTTTASGLGGPGYSPVPADYDGDGRADLAVYHAATGLWFIKQSSTGTLTTVGFGGGGFVTVGP
jgi:hypothetical protein